MTGDPQQPPERELDARFTFANERTLLAWNRTALALVAGGLVVAEYVGGARALIAALPLIAFGAFLAHQSYRRWQNNERALRAGEPLPPSTLPRTLAYGVLAIAIGTAVLAIVH